jgi:hypothetical protein
MASEVVFYGLSGHQRCHVIVTFSEALHEFIRQAQHGLYIRIGTEIVWTHVLHGQCTVELLGPVGIHVVKTPVPRHTFSAEHDVDVNAVQLPGHERTAELNRLYSGDIMFVAGRRDQFAA